MCEHIALAVEKIHLFDSGDTAVRAISKFLKHHRRSGEPGA
jgi:hypothetical protein